MLRALWRSVGPFGGWCGAKTAAVEPPPARQPVHCAGRRLYKSHDAVTLRGSSGGSRAKAASDEWLWRAAAAGATSVGRKKGDRRMLHTRINIEAITSRGRQHQDGSCQQCRGCWRNAPDATSAVGRKRPANWLDAQTIKAAAKLAVRQSAGAKSPPMPLGSRILRGRQS